MLIKELINCPNLLLHFTAFDFVLLGFQHTLFVMTMFFGWLWRQLQVF